MAKQGWLQKPPQVGRQINKYQTYEEKIPFSDR